MDIEKQKALLQELITECDDLKIVDLVELGVFDELNDIDSDPYSQAVSYTPPNGVSANSAKWSRFQYDVAKYFSEFKDEQTQKFKDEFEKLSMPDVSKAGPWILERKIDKIQVLLENMMTDLKYAPASEKNQKTEEKDTDLRHGSSVTIGNNNRISHVTIKQNVKGEQIDESDKKLFFTRHPWISAIICSIIAGFFLLFSFWDKVVNFIEGLIK